MARSMKFSLNKYFIHFLGALIFYVLFALLCRTLSTEHLTLREDWGYTATFGALFAGVIGLFYHKRRPFVFFLGFIFLYVLAALIKRFGGMILSEREIVHTLCLATFLGGLVLTFYEIEALQHLKILKFAACFLLVLFLLPALVMVSYFGLNHAVFSSDIMLTLFQTNFNETLSYLKDQNLGLWGLALLSIIAICAGFVLLLLKSKQEIKSSFARIMIVLVLLVFISLNTLSKINVNFVSNIYSNTRDTLKTFVLYEQNKEARQKMLQSIKNDVYSNLDKGLFVLVIGESSTRDHMGAYGYYRDTTPFMQKEAKENNAVLFENAYANHTHTVPTLSFALSEANQYNNKSVEKAYTLFDMASLGGFETVFISNQPKDSVFITPLAVMASTAGTQIWLNSSIGDKLSTEYYDEKTAEVLSSLKTADKSLVIIHLMGSHGAYRDRYPAEFEKFKDGPSKLVDAYDNSILYTDFVLSKICEAAQHNKNFQALVYLSDHGDDADNRLGHESSRFTYQMSRIPFFLLASSNFANGETFKALKENKDRLFTNDLLFDFMLGLMQINRAEKEDDVYALQSENYPISRQNALTLHGQKKLSDEPSY